jgi:hypothetical protein
MHECDRHAALADRGSDALDRADARVPARKDAMTSQRRKGTSNLNEDNAGEPILYRLDERS